MTFGRTLLGVALLIISVSLILVGRRHSERLGQSSLAFAFYPALILVLIAFGTVLLVTSVTE